VLALPDGVIWAYDNGEVVRSPDDGARWRVALPTWPQTQLALQVTGAFFLNADDAWAVTSHSWPAPPGVTTVWRTTDGGADWQQGTSVPGPVGNTPLDQLVFTSPEDGFGFGALGQPAPGGGTVRHDVFWATTDAGQSWHRQSSSGLPWQASTVSMLPGAVCDSTDPFSLAAVSAQALVLTEDGCPTRTPGVWLSDNGGRSWAPVKLSPPSGGWPAAEAWSYPYEPEAQEGAEVIAVRGFGDGPAVMAVTTRPGEVVIYRSHDAGASWKLASVLKTGSLSRPAGFGASAPADWELPAPAGLYLTTDGGRHWSLQRSVLSVPNMDFVSFGSGKVGIGLASANIGSSGLLTVDGGKAWQPLVWPATGNETSGIPFNTIDFATPMDGWVGGADGIEATSDGGKTWAPQLATAAPVEQLSFADDDDGWALTADELFSTSDGGHRWSAVPETAFGAFSSVQLVSARFGVGVACEQSGTRAVATDDGGRTWVVLGVPDPDDLDCGYSASAAPEPGDGLCFGTPQVGWAALSRYGRKGVLERSTDGGRHWGPVASSEPGPSELACQGTEQAWLGLDWEINMSSAGDLAATADGGRTWRLEATGEPSSLRPPRLTPADGTAVGPLTGAGAPPGLLSEPVAALAVPAAGDAVDLWENGGAGCGPGFGVAVTIDGGTDWSAPSVVTSPGHQCGGTALPFVGPLDMPSISFPDIDDGFVLAGAAGAGQASKDATRAATLALIGTHDAGKTWSLLAHFTGDDVG
jgi:photosystem II stability/assembly factor-like uncharacterized protein